MNKYLVIYAVKNGETTLCYITSKMIEAKSKLDAYLHTPEKIRGYEHLTFEPLHIEILEESEE